MLHPFGRHARTFARALDRGEYARTDTGIVFPRHGARLTGRLSWRAHDRAGRLCDEGSQHNLVTPYGLSLLRASLLQTGSGHVAVVPLHLAPFGNDAAVDTSWTDYYLASPVGAGELTDGPEGYSEAVRQDWTPADASGTVGNVLSPATFTIVTGSQLAVYGYAVVGGTNAKRSGLTDATPFNPTGVTTQFPDIDEITPYGRHLVVGVDDWYDPNGDDVYDVMGGNWTDPTIDDIQIAANHSIFALVRTAPPGTPTLYANGATLTVVYELELAT